MDPIPAPAELPVTAYHTPGWMGPVSGPEPAGLRSLAPAPSPRRHPSLVLGVAGLRVVLLVAGMGWRPVRPPALSAGGSFRDVADPPRVGSRRGRSDARFRSFAAPAGPVQPLQFGLNVVPFVERPEGLGHDHRSAPERSSGNCGSECRQGHGGFDQARWQGPHAEMIQRRPSVERHATYGFRTSLLSSVWALNPFAPFRSTQSCTRRSLRGRSVPLVNHCSTPQRDRLSGRPSCRT